MQKLFIKVEVFSEYVKKLLKIRAQAQARKKISCSWESRVRDRAPDVNKIGRRGAGDAKRIVLLALEKPQDISVMY